MAEDRFKDWPDRGNNHIRQNSSVKFTDKLRGWYLTTQFAAL
jgi:hypothetical protein